ncbi:YcgL domain-containing protein [Marinobacter hydrocarbonoclasticus]|nr:YcgL domain-containing protein [Marinobacter nauticus]
MICAIYKSSRKADTYLYLPKRDDFSKVPKALMEVFGTPLFVMMLPMIKVKQLANADLQKVTDEMREKGYYLQLPPPTEDLLKVHRRDLGLEDQ